MIKNQFRQNFYILLGILIGLLFGSFSPLLLDDGCNSVDYSNESDNSDEYIPKLNVVDKPVKDTQNNLKVLRPRYFSTELGIRKRLFVAVLTTPQTIKSHAIAINKTASHLVDKLTFFIDSPGNQKLNVTYLQLPGIVGFIDTRVALKPFHVLKYIKDNFIENYDYFFIVNDNAYIKARKLDELAKKISVSRDVYLGTTINNSKFCSLNAGILLSNSVLQSMLQNIDWCVKNVYSSEDDENFGKCVIQSTNIECQKEVQGQTFDSYHLNNDILDVDILKSAELNKALTVYPIKNEKTFYLLHIHYSRNELNTAEEQILQLRESILKNSLYTPDGNLSVTWPVGNEPGNRPPTRFDLQRWDYFDENYIYLTNEFSTTRPLNSAEKIDLQIILNASINMINSKYNHLYKFHNLMNGYRRFDPSRGMDYKLDIAFKRQDNGIIEHKRIEICKPLGKVELLSVPYVTENRRVNIILPVRVNDTEFVKSFLEQYKTVCLDKKERVFLVLILIYDLNVPGKESKEDVFASLKTQAQSLTKIYKRDENRIIWLSIKIPFADNQAMREALLKFAILDLSLKKFPPESLMLYATPNMEIKAEYLNRVRMNTIIGWQIFSAIPFSEYSPIIHGVQQKFIDINKRVGHFDSMNTDHISFYVKDYFTVRKEIERYIPLVKSDVDIKMFHTLANGDENSTNLALDTVYSMFVRFGQVHVLRAVESALRLHHQEKDCTPFSNDVMATNNSMFIALHNRCILVRNSNLGARGQLAKLLLEYQEINSNKLNLNSIPSSS